MHSAPLLTGWDTALFILPFLGLLGLWMFGLDELLAAPGSNAGRRRFCQVGTGHDARMTDPDGTLWPRALAADCGMIAPAAPSAVSTRTPRTPVSNMNADTYRCASCCVPPTAETRKSGGKNC